MINAAVVRHCFNQSYAGYYEQIHDFHPDVIINMDGYNDDELAIDTKECGDPYLAAADQIDEGLTLEILQRSGRWGYTCMLLNYHLMNADIAPKDVSPEVLHTIHEISWQEGWRLINGMKEQTVRNIPIIPDSFRLLLPVLKQNMAKQLWLINSYEQQLKHDSVYSIFCLQPVLARKVCQKKLSAKEKAMSQYLNEDAPWPATSFDTVFLKYFQKASRELIDAAAHTGPSKYYLKQYNHEYFVNQYTSPMIGSIVTSAGGSYVDLGKAMINMPDSVEFYMDYTHTTPFGNQFIAAIMAEKVGEYLHKKGNPR